MAVYELEKPIVIGEVKYETLELQEPTMKRLRECNVSVPNVEASSEISVDMMARMIEASCTNVPPIQLAEITMKDVLGAFGVCSDFF